MKRLLISGLITVGMACAPITVQAQYRDNADLGNRLNQIEKQIQTLSRAVFRGETVAPPAMTEGSSANSATAGSVANLDVRISQIEQQLQQLTGQIEEQQYRIDQLARQVEGGRELQPTLTQPEPTPAPPQQATQGQTVAQPAWGGNTSAPAPTSEAEDDLSDLGPDALYEKSFVDIRDGNYDAAEVGFKSFLSQYPDHALASNAQYWLAETYYVRANYTEAAKLFATGYQEFPESSKSADNLLKLGLSLSKLGKTEDACLSFEQLKTQFPDETGPVMRRADQEIQSLNCES